MWTEREAALGDADALVRIRKTAAAGDKVAANYLAYLSGTPGPAPQPMPQPTPGPTPTPTPSPQPTPDGTSFASALDSFSAQLQSLKAALVKLIG